MSKEDKTARPNVFYTKSNALKHDTFTIVSEYKLGNCDTQSVRGAVTIKQNLKKAQNDLNNG